MDWFFTRRYLAVWLALLVSLAVNSFSQAQTINITSNISPATNLCSGSTISLTFSTTGVFTAGNIFSLQMSDVAGSFSSPVDVGFNPTAPTSATTITISAPLGTVAYGTSYRFRVVSDKPVRTSSNITPEVTIGTPSLVVNSLTVCANTGTQPISTTGTNVEWYLSSTSGLAHSGNTYDISTSTATPNSDYYYHVAQKVNSCLSARTAVRVTLAAPTTAPNFTPPAAFCPGQGQSTLTASPTSTGVASTIRWVSLQSGTQTGASIPTPQTTNIYTYTISQFDSHGCVGASTRIESVTVNAAPSSAPTTNRPTNPYCSDDAQNPLSANLSAGATSVKWYNLTDNTTATTATIPAPTSTKQYRISQFAGSCEGPLSSPFSVTVTQKPGDPSLDVTTTGPFCQGPGATQTIKASGSGTIEWFASLSAPTALTTGNSFQISTAGGNVPVYFRQVVNSCGSNRVQGTVTINSTPSSAPTPVLPTNPYCSDVAQSALSAQLSGGATSVKWYNLTDNTTATTSTIPAPTSTKQYKLSQFIGSCEGPLSTNPFSVSVTPKPGDPSLTGGPFCQNTGTNNLQTVTASGSGTIEWFASLSAPTALTTGSSFQISTAGGNVPVYFRQVVNGCGSTRVQGTVTINAQPTAPGVAANVNVCQNEAQQTLSASGNNLTWYVQGSNTALPGAPRPATSTPNSQTIYEVTQTDGNNCTSQRSTGLTFFVRPLPPKPTLAAAFIYCEAQSPTSLTASGTTLRWYSDGGSNRGTFINTTISAPRTFNANGYIYQVTQTDGNGCQSDFLTVPVQVKRTPQPPNVTYANAIASFCQGQSSYQLTATGDNLKWYTSPTSASLTQAPSPATTNQGPTPYYVTQTSSEGCQSDPLIVTALVNQTPGAPTSAQSRTYCAGDAATPLTAIEPGVRWYTSTAPGSVSLAQAPTPGTLASNVATPQLFFVSQTIANCESQQRQQVSVTVKRKPDQPSNISSQAFCQNYAPSVLSAQAETGATLIWVNNGSESAIAPVPPNNVARPYTYQVLQTLNGCRSEPATVTVTVKQTPGQPGITPYSLCFGRESRPLQVSGTELKYYDVNDKLLGATAPSPSTDQVTTVAYKVSQSTDGCEGPKITYNVPVYPIPGNPAFTQPKDYCAEEITTPISATGTALLWYTSANGGTGIGQSPTPSSAASNVGTPQVFYVTQTQNNCESLRQTISVTVKRKPALPTTTSSIEFCQTYGAPNLTATPENGASIIWLVDGRESATGPTPQNDLVKTYTYQVLQDLNGCRSNPATVTVRVKSTPGVPTITPFQLCQLSPGRALQAVGTNLKFYDSNNSPLGSTPPVLPTDVARTLTYKVSQSTDGCEGPKIDYAVVIQPKPAPPATQAVTYCLESSNNPDQPKQTVQPLTAQGQNLKWYYVDDNAYPDGFAPTPGVNSTYSLDFRVTQTVNSCASDKALLRVTVQANPAPVVSSSLVTYCRNDVSRPLEATGPGLRWFDPNGQLLPQSAQNPTPPTANATKGGEAYQVYSVSSSGCASPRSTIRLVVNTNPTLGLLGSTTINYGQSSSLKLLFTSSPPYTYTLTDGTSGIANDTLSSVSVKPLQTTTYRVASVSNVCGNGLPGNPATATVFVNIPTITTQALTTGTVCAGTSFAVAYTTSGTFNTGNGFKVQVADTLSKNYVDVSVAGTGSTLTANLPTTLTGGVYFVRVLATNPGAEVPGQRSPTILTIRGLPAAVLTGTQSIYEGSPASLSIALAGDGPWSISYSSTVDGTQGATSTFQTNANPHILSVIPPKTATYFLTAVSNNCSSGGPVSGSAVITVLPLLAVENPLLNTVSLYPVPTQNLLTVAIDLPLTTREPAQLTLSNLAGIPVLNRQTDTRQTVLDLSQQPAGLYLLNVQVGEHRLVRKIMKQ